MVKMRFAYDQAVVRKFRSRFAKIMKNVYTDMEHFGMKFNTKNTKYENCWI